MDMGIRTKQYLIGSMHVRLQDIVQQRVVQSCLYYRKGFIKIIVIFYKLT